MTTQERAPWYEQPLRDGEFDVVVKFRVTASDFPVAVAKVAHIVEHDQFEHNIVPMFVPVQ